MAFLIFIYYSFMKTKIPTRMKISKPTANATIFQISHTIIGMIKDWFSDELHRLIWKINKVWKGDQSFFVRWFFFSWFFVFRMFFEIRSICHKREKRIMDSVGQWKVLKRKIRTQITNTWWRWRASDETTKKSSQVKSFLSRWNYLLTWTVVSIETYNCNPIFSVLFNRSKRNERKRRRKEK